MLGLAGVAQFALSLLREDRVPNEAAIALAPTIGWVMLACAVIVFVMFIAQSERLRRLFLSAEDPRPLGLFRIGFAFVSICNVNDFFEYFTMLFTDEGIFFTDVAQQLFAAQQFAGFGDGIAKDPWGFFDIHGILTFLEGPKYSPLFFFDSPTAFWTVLVAYHAITIAFLLGWKTRTMGVLSLLLMNGIFIRNQLFWEGTEVVYRVFFIYLIASRCGHAYSIDNWLRCRKLRAQGLLSEPGGPGGGAGVAPSEAHPRGLQAIYRLIPAWPRWLMILNLGALYCYTGTVKNGVVWLRGDALYYALNLDHFHRFYPQQLSALVGTNLFRLATWITHWWEALFPILVFGVIVRWALRERLTPLTGARLWVVRACWIAFGLGVMTTALIAMPVHFLPGVPLNMATRPVQIGFAAAWIAMMALLGGAWWWLGHRPPRPTIRGTTYTLDREWFCRWFLGRRTMLTLGVLFHGNLDLLMNIGMFPHVMIATYVAFLHGDEPGRILRFFGRLLPRWVPGIPADVRRGAPPIPAEDRTLPHLHRDDRHLPEWFMGVILAAAVVGVILQVRGSYNFGWTALAIGGALLVFAYAQGHRGSRGGALRIVLVAGAVVGGIALLRPEGDTWTLIRVNVAAFIAAVMIVRRRVPRLDRGLDHLGLSMSATDRPADPREALTEGSTDHVRAPYAYGPFGRLVIGSLVVWHITAVTVWLLPDKDVLDWRGPAKGVFRTYLLTTLTDQGWGMFAPNPPSHNVFMRAVVVDNSGEKWDMRTDVYAPERRPIPWIWNDRMRKMNRRIIGGEGGNNDMYQKWYARYLCRTWAMAHHGVAPKKVELFKMSYKIPSPEQVRKKGWYVPLQLLTDAGSETRSYTETCRDGINAQVPNVIRERHGLPLLDDNVFKPWVKNRQKSWEKRHEKRGITKPAIAKVRQTVNKARAEVRAARKKTP